MIYKPKVLLADKRELFREGLSVILENIGEVEVVDKCSSGSECLRKAKSLKPDIIILDTEIDNCAFNDVITSIKNASSQVRIIVLTHSERDQDLFSALKLGASAYLTKDIAINDLINSIHRIFGGEVIVSPPMAGYMLREFTDWQEKKEASIANKDYGLSKRESEILSLVTKGWGNREIAKQLFISENTVKAHLSTILEKMGVKNRNEATILALEKGIL